MLFFLRYPSRKTEHLARAARQPPAPRVRLHRLAVRAAIFCLPPPAPDALGTPRRARVARLGLARAEAAAQAKLLFGGSAPLARCDPRGGLLLVKPHAVREGRLGGIVRDVVAAGFELVAGRSAALSRVNASEFLEVYQGVSPEAREWADPKPPSWSAREWANPKPPEPTPRVNLALLSDAGMSHWPAATRIGRTIALSS